MIEVLGNEHLRQQARGGDPLVDDMRCDRRLDEGLAASADPFAADVALDLEHSRGVIELLAHILPDALQAAATSTLGLLRLVADLPTREAGRQRHPAWLRFGCRRWLVLQRFELEADGLQIRINALIQKRALYRIEHLAVTAVAPALEGRHLVGELIDLQLLVFEFLIALCQQRIALGELRSERRGQ